MSLLLGPEIFQKFDVGGGGAWWWVVVKMYFRVPLWYKPCTWDLKPGPIFLKWTNVAWAYVAWTNVTVIAG